MSSLSKAETDVLLLSQAKAEDNNNPENASQIFTRHTSSVHPIDCICNVCVPQKFTGTTINEKGIKEELDYFVGDSHE